MQASIFGKFSNSDKSKRRFLISSDEEYVKSWPSNAKSSDDKEKKKDNIDDSRSFAKINEAIFSAFAAFYEIIPILSYIPRSIPNTILEEEVEKKFKDKGELIQQTDDFLLYSLPIEEYPKINKSIRRAESIRSVSDAFPRFFLMGLVSHYDYFIYQIASAAIRVKPHIVFNKDLNVPYSELIKHNSIDEVKESIVSRELENLLRESHEDQLSWFSRKLDIKIEPRKELLSSFVELCERRNLFAHSGGIVSHTYLKKCGRHFDTSNINIGSVLKVDTKYLINSIETLIEMAFQLLFVVWHKLEPDSGNESSKALINITYSLIQDEKYGISIRLIEFLLSNKSVKMDENTRKTHIINCANAKKLLKREDYKEMIENEDWSASSIEFIICKSAVLDDVDGVIENMEEAVKTNKIGKSEFREWPVFKCIRDNERFAEKYKSVFGEPLVSNEATEHKEVNR